MKKVLVIFILISITLTGCSLENSERNFTTKSYNLELEEGNISGTLTLPNVDGPYPIALIIPGAGAINRDGNNSGNSTRNNCLKMVAEKLGNAGIASVRYDKRGIGKSSELVNQEEDLIFSDYIEDAILWMEKIQSDNRFNKYYIIGHSEGGLVGAAAARELDLDGFISIAAPGEPLHETLIKQLENKMGDYADRSLPIINELKEGNLVPNPPMDLEVLFRPSAQPYLISLFQYEPQYVIQDVDAPILIIQGDNDLQASVKDAEILHNAADSELIIVEGMNHILKESPRDSNKNINTYNKPRLPLHEELVKELIRFIK